MRETRSRGGLAAAAGLAWLPAVLVLGPALDVLGPADVPYQPGAAGPGVAPPSFGLAALVICVLATFAWTLGGLLPVLRQRSLAPASASGALAGVGVATASLVPAVFVVCLFSGPYAHLGYWVAALAGAAFVGVAAGRLVVAPALAGAPAWAPAVAGAFTAGLLFVADLGLGAALPEPQPGLPSVNAADGSHWHFEPGAEDTRHGLTYRFTDAGFRAGEATPPGAKSVLVVGDSIPFGGGYPVEVTFPGAASRVLGPGVAVHNAGIPASSTSQIRAYYAGALAAVPHDLLVVVFHVDDVNRELRYKVGDRLYSRAWPEWLQDLHYRSPLWRLLDGLLEVRDATFLHWRGRTYAEALDDALGELEALVALARQRSAKVAVFDVPYFGWSGQLGDPASYAFAGLSDRVKAWCAERAVPYASALPALAAVDIDALKVAPDDVHLNADGHAVVAGPLAALIRASLR